jgi:hypothetical protein
MISIESIDDLCALAKAASRYVSWANLKRKYGDILEWLQDFTVMNADRFINIENGEEIVLGHVKDDVLIDSKGNWYRKSAPLVVYPLSKEEALEALKGRIFRFY